MFALRRGDLGMDLWKVKPLSMRSVNCIWSLLSSVSWTRFVDLVNGVVDCFLTPRAFGLLDKELKLAFFIVIICGGLLGMPPNLGVSLVSLLMREMLLLS